MVAAVTIFVFALFIITFYTAQVAYDIKLAGNTIPGQHLVWRIKGSFSYGFSVAPSFGWGYYS